MRRRQKLVTDGFKKLAFGGIEDARRRRTLGQTPTNFLLAGSNMRRIDGFVADKAAGTLGRWDSMAVEVDLDRQTTNPSPPNLFVPLGVV